MRCLYPIKIREPDYIRNCSYTYVPCGKCVACLSNKRREWSYRLNRELKNSISAYFITLTYNDENLPKDGLLRKKDVQDFLKRLRKYVSPYKIRFFCIGEYGENFGRPHYHLLLFNFPDCFNIKDALKATWKLCDVSHWDIPNTIGNVTAASINYCSKYCVANLDETPVKYRTFMLCSRRPGIGSCVLTNELFNYLHQDSVSKIVYDVGGLPVSLPRYYVDKLFTDEEKEKFKIENYEYQQKQEKLYKRKYGKYFFRQRYEAEKLRQDEYRKRIKNSYFSTANPAISPDDFLTNEQRRKEALEDASKTFAKDIGNK